MSKIIPETIIAWEGEGEGEGPEGKGKWKEKGKSSRTQRNKPIAEHATLQVNLGTRIDYSTVNPNLRRSFPTYFLVDKII